MSKNIPGIIFFAHIFANLNQKDGLIESFRLLPEVSATPAPIQ
jgi:hypothetical protein